MGLLDKFAENFLGKPTTPTEKPEPVLHVPHRSKTGTKAQRRNRRKIAHESRRVNLRKGL